MRYRKLIPAVIVAALVAGCGSASSSSSSSQPAGGGQATSSPSSAAATTSAAAAAPSRYGAPSGGAASGQAALITTKHSKQLGTILAYGPKEMTVYLFEADHGSTSGCTGTCAKVWPPVTGTPQAQGSALKTDLGTVKRADGTLQVTYNGHPLYRFIKDGDGGDAYGQGLKSFGAPWYVLAPSGAKVDKS